MNAIRHPLLVLLLLLALPFQGLAAAGMLLCAPAAPAAFAAAPAATMAGHDHRAMLRAMTANGHDHAAMQAAHGDGAHVGHAGHAAHDDGRHQGSCASCCVGAAMAPAAPLRLALARPDFIAIPFRAGHVPSVDPAVLERPPRSLFA